MSNAPVEDKMVRQDASHAFRAGKTSASSFPILARLRLSARIALVGGKALLSRTERPASRYLSHLSNVVSDFRRKSCI